MDCQALIGKYYPADDALRRLLMLHSRQVAQRCLSVCDSRPELRIDRTFVGQAAMLHDIGIRWCHAPAIYCTGTEHYLRHGLIGGEVLRREGLPRHARVCERHTGTGLTTPPLAPDGTPLLPPDKVAQRCFVPETIEEQLVCYADKFYSKSHPERVLTIAEAAQSLQRFGQDGVTRFLAWAALFEGYSPDTP